MFLLLFLYARDIYTDKNDTELDDSVPWTADREVLNELHTLL